MEFLWEGYPLFGSTMGSTSFGETIVLYLNTFPTSMGLSMGVVVKTLKGNEGTVEEISFSSLRIL